MKVEKLVELKEKMDEVIATYIAKMGEESSDDEKGVNLINPPADTYFDGKRQIMFIETPALVDSSIKIAVDDDKIVFKADKVSPKRKDRKYLHMERSVGSYLKVIPLSFEKEKVGDIEHTYKYGVIKIVAHCKGE